MPVNAQRALRSIYIAAALVAVASGCRSSTGDGLPSATSSPEEPRPGGTIVVSLGEPLCMDWYTGCGSGNNGVIVHQTLPSPIAFFDGQYRVTPLLAGEPTVEAGPPQRVTYRINPQAMWSDGAPITSSDFKYTWEQARGINARGMGDIAAVDAADPRVAVVTWREPNATWQERFRPILPRHLLEGRDRNTEMKDGYRFSGGPWMVDHWTKGQEFMLVRNPRYWAKQPYLDAIVGKVIPDRSAVHQAYKSGQLDMFAGGLADPGIEEMKGLLDTGFADIPTLSYSFIAFNTQSPPLDRKPVRQALGYATDRDALATQLQGQLRPGIRPLQSLVSTANPMWASDAFARYRRDLNKVTELMRGDGWSRGADGVWARGGVRAQVEFLTDANLHFHTLVAQILQSQWREAGFDLSVKTATAQAINGDLLPKGNYQAAFTGSGVVTSDPGQCVRFCSKNVPSESTRFTGGNITRISNPVLDDVWGRVDAELDTTKRLDLVRRGHETLAEEAPVLPMLTIVEVYVFNSRMLGGPVAAGPHAYLSEWFCRTVCG